MLSFKKIASLKHLNSKQIIELPKVSKRTPRSPNKNFGTRGNLDIIEIYALDFSASLKNNFRYIRIQIKHGRTKYRSW